MSALLSSIILAATVGFSTQAAPKPASIMDELKPFQGHWKGEISMGPMELKVDMTWKAFGGRWAEASYTYSSPQMNLEYRVLMTANAENKGFDCWMFGNDMPHPDTMKGVMEGKTLVVLHNRDNTPDVKFWIDESGDLQFRASMPHENGEEVGRGSMKRVKD